MQPVPYYDHTSQDPSDVRHLNLTTSLDKLLSPNVSNRDSAYAEMIQTVIDQCHEVEHSLKLKPTKLIHACKQYSSETKWTSQRSLHIHKLKNVCDKFDVCPKALLLWDISYASSRWLEPDGRGGFSSVYKAQWNGLSVALKILNTESGMMLKSVRYSHIALSRNYTPNPTLYDI